MQKKIIYITFTCPSHIGVRKKNLAQVAAWELNDVNVQIISDNCKFGSVFKVLYRYWIFILYFFLQKSSGSYIYLRQTTCFPMMSFITRFRKFSYEVNADISKESETLPFLKRNVLKFLKDEFISRADKVFFVSNEISEWYKVSCNSSYVFPNCMQSQCVEKELPRTNKIVFVGTEFQTWQGVDVLLKLIKKLPDYEFHLVGHIANPKLKNVICHGALSGIAYEKLMEKMDFAIGTLAFFRSGLTEGSALKVRDYIRFNLPTIVSYIDSDFSNAEFLFKIDVDKLESEITKINKFFAYWKNRSLKGLIDEDWLCTVRESKRVNFILSDVRAKIIT
jgi:glycosyltransferase involved in cell wall biosynthesis